MPIQQEELTQRLQASSSHTVTLPSGQQGRRSHRRESHFTSELPGSHTPAHFLSCSVKQGNKSFLLGVRLQGAATERDLCGYRDVSNQVFFSALSPCQAAPWNQPTSSSPVHGWDFFLSLEN